MKITCQICGTDFNVPPARAETAKYCSRACRAKGVGALKKGRQMSEETKERLSAALKQKWESGTRKRNPEDTWVRATETRKQRFPNGTYIPAPGSYLKALAAQDPVAVRERCRALGLQKLGVPNPPGRAEAGPDNFKAKYWVLRSPCGQRISGKNLNHLIRENAHLFHPEDLKWNKSRCKASKGLHDLFSTQSDGRLPKSRTWKGWTPILKSEDVEPGPHHGSKIVNLPPLGR